MPNQCFTFTIADQVAHLVLNRPQAMNTIQPVFWREPGAILAILQRDAPARALALGLVNEVFDTQQAMLDAALQMAHEIAQASPAQSTNLGPGGAVVATIEGK
ncbi:MAG: hypothetical protein ABI476_08135 [Oxalobacteraceae bacterium]